MGSSSSVPKITGSEKKATKSPRKTFVTGQKDQTNPKIMEKDKSNNEPKKAEANQDEAVKTKKSEDEIEDPSETTDEIDDSKEAADETNKPKQRTKPPPTREEIEAMKVAVLVKVENHISKMEAVEWLDENEKYVEGANKLILSFEQSYFALKTAPLEDNIESRRQIANAVLKTDILTKICGVIVDIYPKGWATAENKTDLTVFSSLKNAVLFIQNYSDASPEFAERVANIPDFLEMIRRILVESAEPHLKQEQKVNRLKVMKWSLGIVHNISMVESNVARLRSLNFTEVLEPYLKSPEKLVQLNALASLASIIDEKESEMLNSNQDSVKFLMKVLKQSLGSSTRRYQGWSSKESASAIRLLARNDTNKKLLVELGALELLVELAKGSIEEQMEAVGAIWALSFDEQNRKLMVENEEMEVVSTLLNLKTVNQNKIKLSANGALWNLREDLEKTEKFHEIGKQLSSSRHKQKEKTSIQGGLTSKEVEPDQEEEGHIMISYQWGNQKTLIDVRDALIANGLKVWMDIDQMGGSTLQAMADAVENASIVLMCMTQKYKDSPNCRAEAEYAFQQRKKIVPLMLQRGYRPDGWLGFILGAKLFFDFSGKYPFQDKLSELLKELGRIKGQTQVVQTETVVPKKTEPNYHRPVVTDVTDSHRPSPAVQAVLISSQAIDDIRKWTTGDVKNWINKNDLPLEKFGHLTAGEIAALITIRREAPESFYKCLRDMLKITDLLTLSKMLWALNDIGK